MKKSSKRTRWIVFCVFTSLSLFFACASTAGQAEKPTPIPDVSVIAVSPKTVYIGDMFLIKAKTSALAEVVYLGG